MDSSLLQKRSPGSSPRQGKVLAKLLLAFLFFVFLFETIPRFVEIKGLEKETLAPAYLDSPAEKQFEPHPYLIFTPKPGHFGAGTAKERIHGSTGFRGPDLEIPKPEGTFRIACLGGSSTYGTSASSNATTWPTRLEGTLNGGEEGRTFEVLNGGAPSWNSFECLENLAFRVTPFAPDVVLIYMGTNDAECALWPDPESDNSHYRVAWPTYRPSPLEPTLEKSLLYLTWRKYFTDYLEQRADLGFVSKVVPGGTTGESLAQLRVPPELQTPGATGFANFQRNLVSIIAVAKAHGAVPVLVTQALWSPEPDSEDLTHGKTRIAAQDRMVEIVRSLAQEREIPLVEMEPYLEGAAAKEVAETGKQSIFTDSVHLSDHGTELFAAHLAKELHRIGVL